MAKVTPPQTPWSPPPAPLPITIPEYWVCRHISKIHDGIMWYSNPILNLASAPEKQWSGEQMPDAIYHIIDPMTAILYGLATPARLGFPEHLSAWINVCIYGNQGKS